MSKSIEKETRWIWFCFDFVFCYVSIYIYIQHHLDRCDLLERQARKNRHWLYSLGRVLFFFLRYIFLINIPFLFCNNKKAKIYLLLLIWRLRLIHSSGEVANFIFATIYSYKVNTSLSNWVSKEKEIIKYIYCVNLLRYNYNTCILTDGEKEYYFLFFFFLFF